MNNVKQLSMLDEMEMDPYVCKSAIQKAYRRNNWDLFEMCFDFMWKTEPKWLFWRGLIFPAEDAWKSVLPIGRAIRKAEACFKENKDQSKQILLEAFRKELATTKNQDGNALTWYASIMMEKDHNDTFVNLDNILLGLGEKGPRYLRLVEKLIQLTEEMTEGKFDRAVWSQIWNEVNKQTDIKSKNEKEFIAAGAPEEYMELRDTVGALYFRAMKGGGKGYQMLFLSCVLLAIDAYKHKESLSAEPSYRRSETRLEDVVYGVPWYCVDMHTGRGKQVLGYIAKKYQGKWTKSQLEDIWFLKATALVNESCKYGHMWELLKSCLFDDFKFVDYEWNDIGYTIRELLLKSK